MRKTQVTTVPNVNQGILSDCARIIRVQIHGGQVVAAQPVTTLTGRGPNMQPEDCGRQPLHLSLYWPYNRRPCSLPTLGSFQPVSSTSITQ